jgi:hypothetical protein
MSGRVVHGALPQCNEQSTRAIPCVLRVASTQQPVLGDLYGPNLTPAATVMNPIALSRYGSAGELPAWLPIVTGHVRGLSTVNSFHGTPATTPGQ